MRRESFQQYAIVAADSAQELTEQLNAKLIELKDKRPQVTFEGFIARISYTEFATIPESATDSLELKHGIEFTCQDCPYLEPILNKDGTPNLRVKHGNCKYAEYGRTLITGRACDELFNGIKRGEVQLCLKSD